MCAPFQEALTFKIPHMYRTYCSIYALHQDFNLPLDVGLVSVICLMMVAKSYSQSSDLNVINECLCKKNVLPKQIVPMLIRNGIFSGCNSVCVCVSVFWWQIHGKPNILRIFSVHWNMKCIECTDSIWCAPLES